MYDNYKKIIYKSGGFFSGYNSQTGACSTMTPFLFSTLRILYVAAGNADWQIGGHIWRIEKNDLVVVNNTELRRFVTASKDFAYEIFAFLPSVFYPDSTCVKLFYNRSEGFVPVFRASDANYSRIISLIELLRELFLKPRRIRGSPSARIIDYHLNCHIYDTRSHRFARSRKFLRRECRTHFVHG